MNGLPSNVRVETFSGPEPLCRAAACAWVDEVQQAVARQETFSTALSGGRIARVFFEALSVLGKEELRGEPLQKLQFFWADERCVPPEDPESNYGIARELLLRPLGIDEKQVHRIRGEEHPERAASLARAELAEHVEGEAGGGPSLDLILLGMGEDGHVASLFPGEPAEAMNRPETYRAVVGPKPPPNRVTLGYGAIAAARAVWVLISGREKEAALRASLRPSSVTPLGRVLSQRSASVVFTDFGLG